MYQAYAYDPEKKKNVYFKSLKQCCVSCEDDSEDIDGCCCVHALEFEEDGEGEGK